ncbi:MAG: hypothetical protein AAF316_01030 [Cyanobacteria bacterium P01_A01_bin.80]
MDPITTAIVTATAAVGSSAIKDSYSALIALLKKKFGEKNDLVEAVNKLEAKPKSKARKDTVQEEVETAKVNDDPEIVQLAQDLLDKIKEQPGGQQIINQTQTNTVRDVKVGNDFNFAPVQEGIKKT